MLWNATACTQLQQRLTRCCSCRVRRYLERLPSKVRCQLKTWQLRYQLGSLREETEARILRLRGRRLLAHSSQRSRGHLGGNVRACPRSAMFVQSSHAHSCVACCWATQPHICPQIENTYSEPQHPVLAPQACHLHWQLVPRPPQLSSPRAAMGFSKCLSRHDVVP